MPKVIMSDRIPELITAAEESGFSVVPTDRAEALPIPEQRHADMQILKIADRLFILGCCDGLKDRLTEYDVRVCSKPSGSDYPDNISMNMLLFGRKLFGRTDRIDPLVKEYCEQKGIELVFMKQGYARCTTLVLDNESVITADKGVQGVMKKYGAEALPISGEGISLPGYDTGFIGGASMVYQNTVYFFGNASALSDYNKIKAFCTDRGYKIQSLCPGIPLTDIGGAVIL